jgi:hypothetical protein
MARPKKQEPRAAEFPELSCGRCEHYAPEEHVAGEDDCGTCWALPGIPVAISDEESYAWARGAYAEPQHPSCIYFKPKLNS